MKGKTREGIVASPLLRGAARPRCLAAALLAFSACVVPPARSGRSPAGHPLLWCEGTLRDRAGKPAWTPPGNYLVELLPDGSVRVVDNAALTGFPEPRALSLYARTTVDLHLSSIDGPVIGTASTGVLLSLVSFGDEVSEIAFSPRDEREPAARVFVRTADLGTEHDSVPPPPEDPPALTATGIDMSLYTAPGGAVIRRRGCTGPVQILEKTDDSATGARWYRVRISSQVPYDREAPRVVMGGWAPAADFAEPGQCGMASLRIRPEIPLEQARALLPPGFVEREPYSGEPLPDGGSVHWLTGDEPCTEARREGDRLSYSRPLGDLLYTADYGYRYAADEGLMILLGPNFIKRADRGRGEVVEGGGYACGNDYLIVRSSPEGLSVLHNPYPPAEPWKLWAYRPGDTETWYRTGALCEAALARRKAPSDGKVGSLPRLHHGC